MVAVMIMTVHHKGKQKNQSYLSGNSFLLGFDDKNIFTIPHKQVSKFLAIKAFH
jgi:hypothetical protein